MAKYLSVPPDGGWGWAIVFGGMYCLAMWGSIMRCYSTFYHSLMAEYETDYASVAWLSGMFQISYGAFTTIGPFAMRIVDPRILSCTLALISGVSCFVASFCGQLWTVQIFMGLIVGCCQGIINITMFTYVTRYFQKRLHTANQLLCFGVSVGPLLVCPVFQYLIDQYGWRGAIRVIAGFLLNMAVACALLRPIKLLSDLENYSENRQEFIESDLGSDDAERMDNPMLSNLRMEDVGLAGSQSLGVCTPITRRKARDDNANVFSRNSENKDTLEPLDSFEKNLDMTKHESRTAVLGRICRKYHLTLFADRIYYLYTFSWLLFAAAFFSATAYIIPFGKEDLGLTDFAASTLVSAVAGGSLCARVIYALFFDSMPLRWRILYISILYAAFSCAVLLLSFTTDQIGATIVCVLIGLLGGGTDGIYSALIAEVYSVQEYAFVYGYSNILTHSAGTAITVSIGMAVDRFQSLRIAMYVGFGMAVASSATALLMHLAVKRKRRSKEKLQTPTELMQ